MVTSTDSTETVNYTVYHRKKHHVLFYAIAKINDLTYSQRMCPNYHGVCTEKYLFTQTNHLTNFVTRTELDPNFRKSSPHLCWI